VYFVYFWVSVWYTLLNILLEDHQIPCHPQMVELDSPSQAFSDLSNGI
jgi:hypothetical protein